MGAEPVQVALSTHLRLRRPAYREVSRLDTFHYTVELLPCLFDKGWVIGEHHQVVPRMRFARPVEQKAIRSLAVAPLEDVGEEAKLAVEGAEAGVVLRWLDL